MVVARGIGAGVIVWMFFSWFLIIAIFRIFFEFSWWIVTGPLWAPVAYLAIHQLLQLIWLYVIRLVRVKREDMLTVPKCEVCGVPVTTKRRHGWDKTWCEDHRKERLRKEDILTVPKCEVCRVPVTTKRRHGWDEAWCEDHRKERRRKEDILIVPKCEVCGVPVRQRGSLPMDGMRKRF